MTRLNTGQQAFLQYDINKSLDIAKAEGKVKREGKVHGVLRMFVFERVG